MSKFNPTHYSIICWPWFPLVNVAVPFQRAICTATDIIMNTAPLPVIELMKARLKHVAIHCRWKSTCIIHVLHTIQRGITSLLEDFLFAKEGYRRREIRYISHTPPMHTSLTRALCVCVCLFVCVYLCIVDVASFYLSVIGKHLPPVWPRSGLDGIGKRLQGLLCVCVLVRLCLPVHMRICVRHMIPPSSYRQAPGPAGMAWR